MNIDIAIPDDRARMISAIGNMIQSSLDERSIAQHAEMILDEYIVRTNHHIWLVGQCAKILRDIIISRGQDIEMFDTNVEFHDYDKTHNDEILPVYALACHYFYFHNKDVKYKVDEEWLNHEFEDVAWPKHHKANKHHYAEYYGKKNDKGVLEVPETYDILNLVEMYADWMAMGITNGGTAHEWWTKNYGPDNKFDFHGRDLGVIQECILAEDKAVNQLAYLRQFKDVEPTWVPPMEIETHDEVDPLTTKEVNEGIENFFNYESNEVLSLKRDDLFIGPIDPMCIDPEKMMKLAEYPDLLLALKKWTTTPDFNLAPQLTMLGKIVDDIYQFKNPITCYRGIRTGFDSRSNKKQNLMGVIDNDIEYLRLLKPGFDKAGTTFEYETQEPMSVARSPYIAKIYGNFIIKTEVPSDANKLVITPELSYLLQQMEVEYPEYRAVNLSITHEVVVFTGTKLTFEIVSVYGDISNELETMKEHSFEGLGNTEMNGVYFSIDKSLEVHEYNTKDDEDAPESHFDWSDFFGELAAAFKGRRPYTGIFEDLYKTQGGTVAFKQALQRVINMYVGALKQDPIKMLTNTCLWIANRSGDKVSGIPEAKKAAIMLGESIFPKFDESILYFKRGTVTLATAGVKERIVLFRNRRNTISKLFDKIKTQSTDVIKLYQNAKNNTVTSSIEKSYIEAAKSILDIRVNQLKEQLVQFEKITKQIIDEYDKEIETLKKQLKEFAKSEESIKSDDYDDISIEALSPDIKKKKQLIIDYICSVCDIMDPSKLNSKRYHRLLDSMSDKEFDQWMHYVKEGKWKIHIVAPNLVVTLKNENSLKAADKVKCKLFHRLWMTDDSTGRQYLTDNEYLVLNLPVRRQQQFLDEKMSVPDNDRQIDGMTGQVTGDSKSSAVTNPEIQILAARGLDATLEEFVNVRGGNIAAYSDFKRQAEETGEIKLNSLDPNTRSRVAVVGQVLLRSMMIENNILE